MMHGVLNEYRLCYILHTITYNYNATYMADETLITYNLSFSDHTLILNALHYYKKVEKRDEFKQFTDDIINNLRDRMCKQLVDNAWDELPSWRKE